MTPMNRSNGKRHVSWSTNVGGERRIYYKYLVQFDVVHQYDAGRSLASSNEGCNGYCYDATPWGPEAWILM